MSKLRHAIQLASSICLALGAAGCARSSQVFPDVGPGVDSSTADVGSGPSDRCDSAEVVVLSGGQAVVVGDTSTASDEFPELDCNSAGTADTLVGPQRYYVLHAQRGMTYSFVLTPGFHSVFYGFERRVGCTAEAIESACRSEGESGFGSALINPGTGRPGATVFGEPPDYVATEDLDLVLVVDSDGGSGGFELTIVEAES